VQLLAIEAQPGFLQMHVSSLPNARQYGARVWMGLRRLG
jgi:hypothetical protein